MRIRPQDITAIRTTIYATAPAAGAICLFGSRLNDDARGGDIDLMVDFESPVENPAFLAARLAVQVSRAVFNRKVDVILRAPNLINIAIHQIALDEGVML